MGFIGFTSGKRLHNYGKIHPPSFMGKRPRTFKWAMASIACYVKVITRGYKWKMLWMDAKSCITKFGWLKPYKSWDVFNHRFEISGAGFRNHTKPYVEKHIE